MRMMGDFELIRKLYIIEFINMGVYRYLFVDLFKFSLIVG